MRIPRIYQTIQDLLQRVDGKTMWTNFFENLLQIIKVDMKGGRETYLEDPVLCA